MDIQDIIDRIKENKSQLGITLYPPASLADITSFENALDIVTPEDIKTFYKFCNGFESAEDIFRVIPLKESIEQSDKLQKNQFYIAEYMIYSDMWGVELNAIDNNYLISEFSFQTALTNSFAEFLNRFLIGGVFEKDGLYDWKDQINNDTSDL